MPEIRENDFTYYLETGDPRISSEASRAQVACYRELFSAATQASYDLLDIGCGDGRQTLLLAESWRSVTGVDSSLGLLKKACRDAQNGKIGNATFSCANMLALPFRNNRFNGVLSGFSSWGFFGPPQDAEAIREAARVLKPGQVFVLDYGNAAPHYRELEESGEYDPATGRMVKRQTFDAPDAGGKVNRVSWIEDGNRYRWVCQRVRDGRLIIKGTQMLYSVEEIMGTLAAAGLVVEGIGNNDDGIYGNHDLTPMDDLSPRIIVRTVKP